MRAGDGIGTALCGIRYRLPGLLRVDPATLSRGERGQWQPTGTFADRGLAFLDQERHDRQACQGHHSGRARSETRMPRV